MKISKSEKVASRIIEGQAFVVTPANSTLHLFNEVGTRIWQLIEERKNIEEIIKTICAEYEVGRATAKKDIHEFLRTLEKKSILKVV